MTLPITNKEEWRNKIFDLRMKPIFHAFQLNQQNVVIKKRQHIFPGCIVSLEIEPSGLGSTGMKLMTCGEPNITINQKQYDYDVIVDTKMPNPGKYQLENAKCIYFPFYVWSFVERFQNNPFDLIKQNNSAKIVSKQKTKFCAYFYSHKVGHRRDFFNKLSKQYKQVHDLGAAKKNLRTQNATRKVLAVGNQSYLDICVEEYRPYKFVICFENTLNINGYITEKIVNAMLAGAIPIYWGTKDISQHFNDKSFINVHNYKNLGQVIQRIKQIDQNEQLYHQMLQEPWFKNNELNEYFDANYLQKKFCCV